MLRNALALAVALPLSAAACGGSSSTGGGGGDGAPLTSAECATYTACDATTSCPSGTTCAVVDDCSTPICIGEAEACGKRCGTRDCLIAESYPIQIGCAPRESGAGGSGTGGASGAAGSGGTGAGGGAGAGAGGTSGARTCDDVRRDLETELATIQACGSADECGQVLQGTSCGCTRDLVARTDADPSRVAALLAEQIGGETCAGLGSTCDCPEANGFSCVDGRCGWNYVTAE